VTFRGTGPLEKQARKQSCLAFRGRLDQQVQEENPLGPARPILSSGAAGEPTQSKAAADGGPPAVTVTSDLKATAWAPKSNINSRKAILTQY
jgi:hypothetical protein